MGRAIWNFMCFLVLFFNLGVSTALPINQDYSYGDDHTHLLTGLVGILLTVCGVVCLAGCLCCQKKNGFKDKHEEKLEKEFQNTVVVEAIPNSGDHGHINPLASTANVQCEFTIFNPLTKDSSSQQDVFVEQNSVVYSSDDWKFEDKDVREWFNNGEAEFPRTKLKYIREMGKGWFGRVVEGAALGLDANDKDAWKPVVVRILEATASLRQRILFLHDASIYRCLPHPNILLLLGRSLDSVPLLLLQEYTIKGDLKSYLKKNCTVQNIAHSGLSLKWCYQLTSALRHLHTSNVVHSDLATRNCRLTNELDLKLGDYGCSTTDYSEDYYHGSESVPIRWCAPEIITFTSTTLQAKASTQSSNIWSLGVCFWEIFECGAQPYRDLNDDEVVSQVLGPPHIRLSQPQIDADITKYMYRLMQICWSTYQFRPTINEAYLMIEDLVNSSSSTYSIQLTDFDERWNKLKPNICKETWDISLEGSQFLNRAISYDNLESSDSWPMQENNAQTHNYSVSTDCTEQISIEFKAPEDIQFQLGPIDKVLRSSSESETEDENWKRKVECGLYTEKVRQKSQSVANLMILTHIDCSESESETPLTSMNYKGYRYDPRPTLENASLSFGSEGNLLSVQNNFEEELRKLQNERRENQSLVPDKSIDVSKLSQQAKLMDELNSASTIEPPNQIFNVYNVITISPTISPVHATDLDKIINYKDDIEEPICEASRNAIVCKREIPKLSEIIENNIELMDYIIAKYDPENELVDIEVTEIQAREQIVPDGDTELAKGESSESDEYVTANTHTVSESTEEVTELNSRSDHKGTNKVLPQVAEENINECSLSQKNSESPDDETEEYFTLMSQQNSVSGDEITDADLTYCCDKPQLKHVVDVLPTECTKKTKENVPIDTYEYIVQTNNEVSEKSVQDLHEFQIKSLQSILTDNNSEVICSSKSNTTITKTQEFLNNEILTYEDSNENLCNKLHEEVANENIDFVNFSSTPLHSPSKCENKKPNLKYSLENWDNFLGKSFDEQHENDDYSDQPMSLLFTEDDGFEQCDTMPKCISDIEKLSENMEINNDSQAETFIEEGAAEADITESCLNDTYIINEVESFNNNTFVKDVSPEDIYLQMEDGNECYENPSYWETQNSSGWYLHPHPDNEELQGDMDISQEDDSYVRFNMDDEVMAAIRNELIMKLPQAQKAGADQTEDLDGEYETTNHHEVFLRYNCFNTPLSPIPEESFSEIINSGQSSPHCTINTEMVDSDSESDWSEAGLGAHSLEEDTHSPKLMESPNKMTQNRHTPSQDSCCSNDTLFNLEELQYNEKQLQDIEDCKRRSEETALIVNGIMECIMNDAMIICGTIEDKLFIDSECEVNVLATPSESENIDSLPSSVDVTVMQLDNYKQLPVAETKFTTAPNVEIQEFIDIERSAALDVLPNNKISVNDTDVNHLSPQDTVCFMLQHVAPLNSPEDRPWKHIEASLTRCTEFSEYSASPVNGMYDYVNIKSDNAALNNHDEEYEKHMNLRNVLSNQHNDLYACIDDATSGNHSYANVSYEVPIYANSETKEHMYENLDCQTSAQETEYANTNKCHSFNYNETYCPLEDIRFSGPENIEMITSFSESNEDHEWDSGSESRSSSSGEFIWKEGEHESSVKALQAPPQEETSVGNNDSKDDEESSSCSDEDLDGIEFVPSAWDKFATPSKSAMRSPEKTIDRNTKKGRGVSFKKQKYHCVYEYPREPETTIQNYDLWKSQSYIDWDLDKSTDSYLPGSSDYETGSSSDACLTSNQEVNYDFTGSYNLDDDFYISSSTKPFDILEAATSQFFPGRHCEWSEMIKNNDNVTPDSGVEDITPGSLSDSSDYVRPNRQILPLKSLAQLAINKNISMGNNEIGGLRHTRNRLKLDLPPSPNAFTKSKNGIFDSPEIGPLPSQIPTFTTFGKSRFFVQQVDTSSANDNKSNVSFEALPYKPMSKQIFKSKHDRSDKNRIEIVRGEASLLDSADEDSGIESSTLERRNVSEVSD